MDKDFTILGFVILCVFGVVLVALAPLIYIIGALVVGFFSAL